MFEVLAVRILNQTSSTEQEKTLDASELITSQALCSAFQWVPACYDAVISGRKKTGSDGFEFNSD